MPRVISQSLQFLSHLARIVPSLSLGTGNGDAIARGGPPLLKLAGSGSVGSLKSQTTALRPEPGFTHALYTATLQPGDTFPTDVVCESMIILVQKGQIQVTSPDGFSTVSVGHGPAITRGPRGLTLVHTGDLTLTSGETAYLRPGNSVASEGEAIEVLAVGKTEVTLVVSVVIGQPTMAFNLCWICPGH